MYRNHLHKSIQIANIYVNIFLGLAQWQPEPDLMPIQLGPQSFMLSLKQHLSLELCHGQLEIVHGPQINPLSDLKTEIFQPGDYKYTRRKFRRREIVKTEVSGNCFWRIYPQTRLRGQSVLLSPGFSSHLDIVPYSISQRN